MAIDDAVKRLRGPKGTPVHITIVRQGYDTPLEFTVIRDEIPLHSVPYFFMATKKTGYIRLTDFNETTACRPGEGEDCEQELEKALRTLHAAGRHLADPGHPRQPGRPARPGLRGLEPVPEEGADGGLHPRPHQARRVQLRDREDSPFAECRSSCSRRKHSASASEIVAGAIQDHDRGLIVGETTFGKGLVQTIMPLRNVRGYALALTTARYYTPSGPLHPARLRVRPPSRTTSRPRTARRATRRAAARPSSRTPGARSFGGDGITPDFCVEQETPVKFVAYLISKAAFGGFARSFSAAETTGSAADIAGAGKRSEVSAAKLRIVGRDFQVDDRTMADFKSYLDTRKLKYTPEELAANREAIAHQITEQVLLQVFGEGEARRRSMAWDPQVKKALDLVPKSDLLLKDPQKFIAERVAENRPVGAPPAQ